MKCPNCGNTDLVPKFKWCPLCGSKLPHASAAQGPSTGKKNGREAFTTAQQTDARGKSDVGVDKGRFEGIFV